MNELRDENIGGATQRVARTDVKPLRIVMLSYERGFLESRNYASYRLQVMASDSHRITVLLLSHCAQTSQFHPSPNIRVFGFKQSAPRRLLTVLFRSIKEIRMASKANEIPILTAQDPFIAGSLAFFISRVFNVPYEVQEHGDFFSGYWEKEKFFVHSIWLMVAQLILNHADHIRVVSERVSDNLRRKLRVSKEKISILPVAHQFKWHLSDAGRKLNKAIPSVPIIAVPCRFVWQKGLDVLVKACAILKKQNVAFKVKIIGSGPLEEKIKKQIIRLGLSDEIMIESWAKRPKQLWKDADLFVCSSRYEGWGRTIVEAIASGIPVVTTNVGCVGSILRPDIDVRVVEPEDAEALAAAIKKQLEDIMQSRLMSLDAIKELAKKFPIDTYKPANSDDGEVGFVFNRDGLKKQVKSMKDEWSKMVENDEHQNRRAWVWTSAVIGFAILVRGLSVALFWKTLGPNREWGFFTLVQNWFLGYGYSFAQSIGCLSAYRSPGFLFFLTGVYGLFGYANFFAQAVIQNALAVLLTYMVYRLGWAISKDRRVGLVAALLTVIHPYTFYHYTQYYHTALSGLFLVTLLWALVRLEETKRLGWAVAAGVLIAALAYVQGTILPATALLSAWLLWRWWPDWKKALGAVAVMGVVSAALIAPWTYRNWQAFHRLVPLTTDLGHALAKANNENIYGLTVLGFPQEVQTSERIFNPENPLEVRYVMLPEAEAALRERGWLKPSRLFSEWHPREPGESGQTCAALSALSEPEFNDYWTKIGMDWFKQNYRNEAWKLQLLKIGGFWSPLLTPGLKYGAQWSFADSGWKMLAARWSLAGYVMALEFFALAGLVVLKRRKKLGVIMPVIIVFAVYTALHSIIAGYTKYRIPLDNLLSILAAVACVAIWDRLRDRKKS